MRRAGGVVVAAGIALALLPSVSARVQKKRPLPPKTPVGTLRQIGCVTDRDAPAEGCAKAAALRDTAFFATSADGRFTYATSRTSNSVVVFARNRTTGALTETSCVQQAGISGPVCGGSAPGLNRPTGIVVTPDGRYVYVAANYGNAIVGFDRNAQTGALTARGCVTDVDSPDRSCTVKAAGLRGAIQLALSPDARNLYVASTGSNALVTFRRDPVTGFITETACVSDAVRHDRNCGNADALEMADSIALSRDGRNVYVTGSRSSSIVTFARDPATGAVTEVACVSGDVGYRRDPKCTGGRGIQYAQSVVLSPDDRFAYVSATDSHTIGLFARNRSTGKLGQLRGPAGCIRDSGYPGRSRCGKATGIALPLGLQITRDGRYAYLAGFGYGSVTAYTRNPKTGALKQIGKCIADSDPRCPKGKGLVRAGFLTLSPDERHVYVNAPSGNSIAIFARKLR